MRNAFFRSLPLVLLLHGCSPDPGSTRIIAHGGAGSDHPPNSREALLHALAIGAHGIEMDVQLTADSVLVLFHDQYLDEISTCKGLINSSTWKELKACRVPNDGKQTPFRGHPVFIAQHATATCCRGCLAKWHHIPEGQALSPEQQHYVVAVIHHWLVIQMNKAV